MPGSCLEIRGSQPSPKREAPTPDIPAGQRRLAGLYDCAEGDHCDFVASWAYYDIARYLDSKDAVERLTAIESLLTQNEMQRALTLPQTV